MKLLFRLSLLILCSTPGWCTLKRSRRSTTGLVDPNHISLQYPDLIRYLPSLCKQYDRIRQPWFKRRQEQVVAVNEQLIPHPFYPFDHQHQGQESYVDQPITTTMFDRIPPNDLYSINQQQYVQNSYPNDRYYQTQIQRPPQQQIPQNYIDIYPPQYGIPYNRNYNKINQPNTNVAKTINIDINADKASQMGINKNILTQQSIRPTNQMQTAHSINTPQYLNTEDYGQIYSTIPDTEYVPSGIYPRSTTFIRFPLELYEKFGTDPNVDKELKLPKDQGLSYIINPSVLSVFDEYIQEKIDASQKSRIQEKRSDKASNTTDSDKS